MCDLFEPSKNVSTSTSTTGPAKRYQDAYASILKQAQGVAKTPYDTATESQVAGFTAPQFQAFNQVQQNQGVATPYINQAFNYTQQAASPVTGNVQQYMDPYLQNVVNATQQQFDTQNQRQLMDVRANAAKQGALGGSGRQVAEALTKEAQMNAQNPVIAGLYSQGYNQAIGAAQTDASRQLQAAGVAGNLGTQAQQAGYTDINALLGIGGMQQQLGQSQLDTATANAQQRAAYPYQNLQWLSGMATGLGGASGTTTTGTATQPGPSVGQQIIGAGLAGLSFFADGGRVMPYGGGNSYIPDIDMSAAHGGGPSPSLAQASGSQSASGMGDLLSNYKQAHSALSGMDKIGQWMRTSSSPGSGVELNDWKSTVNPYGVQGLSNFTQNTRGPGWLGFSRGGGVGRLGYADGGDVLDMEDDGSGTYAVPEAFPDNDSLFADATPSHDSGLAALAPVATQPEQPTGVVAPVTTPQAAEQGGGLFGWSDATRQGLIQAGLGIMASQSPNLGVALGQGGLQGMKAYNSAQEEAEKQKVQKARIAQSAAALQQRAQQAAEALKFKREQHESNQRFRDAQIAKMEAENAQGRIMEVNGRLVRIGPDGNTQEIYAGAPSATAAPQIVEIYDDQGRKQKAMWDAASGKYVPIGGAAVTNQGATVLDREQAKADIKRVNEYKDAADAAAEMRGNLANLKAARAETTREGPWLGMLPNFSNEAQRVAAEAENVRLSFVGKTKGAVSDSEMRIFGQATPGMDMHDKAATPIIEGMELAAQRAQERAIFFDTWLRSRRNLDGAPQAWKKFTDTHPIIQQEQNGRFKLMPQNVDNWRSFIPVGDQDASQVDAPSDTPEAGTVIDGYRFLGGDPADQSNWEAE